VSPQTVFIRGGPARALGDHLTIGSVINTVYSLFDVPKTHYRLLGRDLPAAPVLNGLIA
jgi:hypothetical protein